MRRIGDIWQEIVRATPETRRKEMENETYTFHPLRHMYVNDRKKRSVWYANNADKEILAPVTKVLSQHIIPKLSGHTYSSIRDRGLMSMLAKVEQLARRHAEGYYVQYDIAKYYDSIDHTRLLECLSHYIKDAKVLTFVERRLKACPVGGLPIGLSFSSYLANLFLTDFDRWMDAEGFDYVRYMDDGLVFCRDKEEAVACLEAITSRLAAKGLAVKKNARVAPVGSGVIYCGFKIWPTHTLLRKNIREAVKRRHRTLERRGADDEMYKRRMAPYFGWMLHTDSWHLMRKTMGERIRVFEHNIMEYKRLKDKKIEQNWFALPKEARISIRDIMGKDVVIFESQEVEVFKERKCAFRFAFPDREDEMHYAITRSEVIMDRLQKDAAAWPAVVTFLEKTGANGRKYVCYE